MQEKKCIKINGQEAIPFHNNMDFCIGTGRMGLALQAEYQKQLKLVQEEIGFSHIRGHGLFSDDMAIYQEYEEDGEVKREYNFTYLDLVMDSYRKLGLRPFLELGFMPEKLASGTQTVFYWKGNVTPPKDYDIWCEMIQHTLRHLMEQYGADEVVQWPVEVWNEPNLPGFWEHADMQEYFKLFERSFYAVKEVDSRFQVGGPAVCGGSDEVWIKAFLEFCDSKDIPVDYVTRHHYTTEFPEDQGHYGYAKLSEPEDGFKNLKTTRDITDSFERYRGLPIHITENNTSYIPNCPLHDTNKNAAYMAGQLARLGDGNASYSYWTFGDIFEERGVPFTPFHGGFGLVANGCIPKPTFQTFKFFKQLQGQCVHRSDKALVVKTKRGSYRGILWNQSNQRTGRVLNLTLELAAPIFYNEVGAVASGSGGGQGNVAGEQKYVLVTKTVDEDTCNPLKVWHDLGEPRSLSKEQLTIVKEAANPLVQTRQIEAADGVCELTFIVQEFGVIYFELMPVKVQGDRGYDYNRVMKF